MRRLTYGGLLLTVIMFAGGAGCKRREPVRLEPTDESSQTLSSSVEMGDPKAAVQLIKGFYDVEQNAWRWTAGKFAVTLRAPAGSKSNGARLVAKLNIPEAVIGKVYSTTLSASINGSPIGSQTYK